LWQGEAAELDHHYDIITIAPWYNKKCNYAAGIESLRSIDRLNILDPFGCADDAAPVTPWEWTLGTVQNIQQLHFI